MLNHQALPSSVHMLISHMPQLEEVPSTRNLRFGRSKSALPPPEPLDACRSATARLDGACVEVGLSGLSGGRCGARELLASRECALREDRGVCAPPAALAGGSAADAARVRAVLRACARPTAVLLGVSPELWEAAGVPALLAQGWSAIVAAPRAADLAKLTAPAWRSAHVRVVRGTAVCPLSELGDERRRAPVYSLNASAGRGTNRSDLRCLQQRQLGELSTFSEAHLLRHQAFFRPQTPRKCAACARLLGRPLPPDCLADAFRGSAVAREEVDCTPPSRLLLGVSRVDLLAIHAPGALDKVVARYPFDALPPATVAVWPEPALEPDVAGLEARLRAAGYSRANAKAGKRARQPNLQLWRRAAAAPPPPAAVASVVAAAARQKFMTGGAACTPAAPQPGKRTTGLETPMCRPFCKARHAKKHCAQCKCAACEFCGGGQLRARRRLRQRPAVPPPSTSALVAPSEWSYSALLWLCIRSPSFVFLHIPKNAGTSVQMDDRDSPYAVAMAARRNRSKYAGCSPLESTCPSAPMGGLRNGTYALAVDATKPPRWCNRAARCKIARPGVAVLQRCRTSVNQRWEWHVTPDDLRLCGVAWDFYGRAGTKTYCVVRAPVERFVSMLVFARRLPSMWPARCGAASDWRRPHRYVNGSQAATVRAQVGCFIREARKLLALYESVRASMVRFQGRGDVDGATRYSGEAPPVMLFTELLHFVLPQAAYVRRRDGTAACDLPFTMADVKAAGGPHAFDSSASTKGEEARGVHEALEADGGALLAEVKAAYADDLALWERARRREAVSEAHESLAASLERYREKVPWVRTKAPPTCESQGGGCSCSACCWARGSKEEAAAGPGPPSRRCAVCGVEKEACGGLPASRSV